MTDPDMPSHHGPARAGPGPRTYPNETIRLLHERASARDFSDRPIPEEVLAPVLEAGIHAPTGGNLQPYSVILIEDAAMREKLAELCRQMYMAKAPVHLLFCIDWRRIERWARLEVAPFAAADSFRHFWISMQDTIICAQNICTAADSVGLGSVYIGTVMEHFPLVREMLDVPRGVVPVVLLCLGYPRVIPPPRRKLGCDIVVHREKYRELSDEALLQAFEEKYRGQRVEPTPERLETVRGVCRRVHGETFAQECLQRIEENGTIRPVQRYFGLHYRADEMAADNEEFVRQMEEFGCAWFKAPPFKAHPVHPSASDT